MWHNLSDEAEVRALIGDHTYRLGDRRYHRLLMINFALRLVNPIVEKGYGG